MIFGLFHILDLSHSFEKDETHESEERSELMELRVDLFLTQLINSITRIVPAQCVLLRAL